MTPVNVANIALLEMGSRVQIQSFSDATPQAQAANTLYTPKTQMLLRAARWDFARAQASLTLWKAAIINGVASGNPPPQPFLYSYLWPSDCLSARFLIPTAITAAAGTPLTTAPNLAPWALRPPTDASMVIGTDFNAQGQPIKVILTNLPAAQLIYTRDLSQVPDLWDPLYLGAATAFLGSFFINALARNKAQYDDAVAAAKGFIDQARVVNGNEGTPSIDRQASWITARFTTGNSWPYNQGGVGSYYDAVIFADGQRY